MPNKKRFPVLTVTIGARGSIGSTLKRHDSLKEGFAYANGRKAQAASDGKSTEFAVVIRSIARGSSNMPTLVQTSATAKQRSTLRNGSPRYPFAVVKMAKNGTPASVSGRNSNYGKAAASASEKARYNGSEYAVVVRTAVRGGSFPTFSGV